MAIDLRVTTLYLSRPLTDLSWEQKFSETLGRHNFGLYPNDDPFWVKFESIDGRSVMYVIESTSFPTFCTKKKDAADEIVRCDYKALMIPSDQGLPSELRQSARGKLNAVLSELELEVIEEETK